MSSLAPLPAPPAATRLRAYSQLRISYQPTASRTSSTLFPIAPAIRSASSCCCLAGHATHAHAVELSALRRNHAGGRAPLRCATPPPISASSQPVRSMNPHPQPRISLVLRHAHWFSVSHSPKCSIVARSRLSDAAPHAHSPGDHQLKPKCTASNGNLANDQNRLIHIQTP